MESQVNERVIVLKTQLRLTDIEFCSRAGISTGTLHRIKNGTELSSKVIQLLTSSLNVNKEWLLHGTGEMFLPGQNTAAESQSDNVWKDEAYQSLKEEVKYLREMLRLAMSGTKSFPSDIIGAGLLQMEKFGNIVRA
jgi:transcriptional regulator with XRE-family HTH domain